MKYYCLKTKSKTHSCKRIFLHLDRILPGKCTHLRKIQNYVYIFFKDYNEAEKYAEFKRSKSKIFESDRFGTILHMCDKQ